VADILAIQHVNRTDARAHRLVRPKWSEQQWNQNKDLKKVFRFHGHILLMQNPYETRYLSRRTQSSMTIGKLSFLPDKEGGSWIWIFKTRFHCGNDNSLPASLYDRAVLYCVTGVLRIHFYF
jgi:hypothetical protein